MASFILIHGSWHGGWCFDAVRKILEAEGHEVIAPDLPGMGGNAATLRAVTLDSWADFAADLCRTAQQSPVVLAGHSRGGLVISQAAENDPDAMDALVYICAMMLPDGLSRAAFKGMEEHNPAFDGIITPVHDHAGTIVDQHKAAAIFAQLAPANVAAEAMQRLVAEPHGPRSTPLRLTAARFGSRPRTYVECTDDRTILLSSQRLMQTLVPGAERTSLWADHSPHLSRPNALAAALTAAADRINR